MTSNVPKATIRLETDLQKKLKHIAEFEGRSFNKEIWYILKSYVANFERKHGKIHVEE